jgi:tRNA pseudouridine38-40 synthase
VPHFKLTLAYDGHDFVGWQRQADGISIQGLLEDALATLDKQPVAVVGAGRTDAGVHALAQVACCALQRDIDAATLVRALNAALPETVRVLDAADAAPDFHARFDARIKSYQYRIWNAEVLPPFERSYVWHVPAPPLDVDAMASAAAMLEGRHDFAAFQGTGATTHTTVRTLYSSRITGPAMPELASSDRGERGRVTYDVAGDGFLRHMVRNIVGTLVEIGRGRRRPEWMVEVLASRDRRRAGRTAPANGLFLVGVEYDAQL